MEQLSKPLHQAYPNLQQRLGHKPQPGYHHDHDFDKASASERARDLGLGLLMGAGVIGLGIFENRTKTLETSIKRIKKLSGGKGEAAYGNFKGHVDDFVKGAKKAGHDHHNHGSHDACSTGTCGHDHGAHNHGPKHGHDDEKAWQLKLPQWARPQVESASLLSLNPSTIVKALGLAGSVSMINRGLGIHLAPPLLALELGAAFHSLVPGTLGMKTAHFLTMAPVLGGTALLASQAHNVVNNQVDQNEGLGETTKTFLKAGSGFALSGATAVGAMAAFPRWNMFLTELGAKGGNKGWYMQTAQHIDAVRSALREAFRPMYKGNGGLKFSALKKEVWEGLGERWKQGRELPFLNKGDARLKELGYAEGYNYYAHHIPMMEGKNGLADYLYNTLKAVRYTRTSKETLATKMTGESYETNAKIPEAFLPSYHHELEHLTDGHYQEVKARFESLLNKGTENASYTAAFTEAKEKFKDVESEVVRDTLAFRELGITYEPLKKYLEVPHPQRDGIEIQQDIKKLAGGTWQLPNPMQNVGSSKISLSASGLSDITSTQEPEFNYDSSSLGMLGSMALYSHDMLEILKNNNAETLFDSLADDAPEFMKQLKAVHEKLTQHGKIMAQGSTLGDNFKLLTEAHQAIAPLNENGHLQKERRSDIVEHLKGTGWNEAQAQAFVKRLDDYVHTVDHANGHNPQVTKAWTFEAGVGGAVCANGCCAGSIFCWNEAVALLSSSAAVLGHALGFGKKDDDKKTKNQPPSGAVLNQPLPPQPRLLN